MNGIQVGIVSWSVKPCTIAPYPGEILDNQFRLQKLPSKVFASGVYTGVSHYIDWIKKITGLDFKLNVFLRASNE